MKNISKNVTFTQESMDTLMESFAENVAQINRLASPLAKMNIALDEGDPSEN